MIRPIRDRIREFPTDPGVYLMKDKAGKIVYVGKAANLRSRLRSYFARSGDERFFVRLLDDVLGDMQSDRPMDRLICGDVGYGKTEIAVRAAFKAVQDGKQVAVLVPTTLRPEHPEDLLERAIRRDRRFDPSARLALVPMGEDWLVIPVAQARGVARPLLAAWLEEGAR